MIFSLPKGLATAALASLLLGCQTDPPKQALAAACATEVDRIQSIQGLGSTSPFLGERRSIKAIVTHWRAHNDGGAVYLQDLVTDPHDVASSGLFVDLSALADTRLIEPGSVLWVTGTVTEENQQTSLKAIATAHCGQQTLPPARIVSSLPLAKGGLENLEGMRVDVQVDLTVADLYSIGHAGRFSVASGGRLYVPTEVVKPGPDAQAMQAANQARTLTVSAPPGSIELQSLPRSGDQLSNASGVLGQWRGSYQLYLDQAPQFRTLNPRGEAPGRQGNLRVSSFNVLNYFNGDGQGGDFPTPRGATNPAELERQQAKILAAMQAIDADIFALAELENDGYQQNSAVSQLTAALNASGKRSYQFVPAPGGSLGEGLIAVGLLYDPSVVRTKGPSMSITEPPFDRRHRPPLLQTFTHLASDREITVVALHLKSKRCNDPQGENADLGDGQSCWNAARTEAARFLAERFNHDPCAGTESDNILMLGDYNAHSREDPLSALIEAGYVNVMAHSAPHHSFVFQGQSGALDHGFANPGLAALATASVWHINADEASWLDYNSEFKTPEIDALLYRPNAYRSSDHDPLIIDLRF